LPSETTPDFKTQRFGFLTRINSMSGSSANKNSFVQRLA
jgi:hypothetical protein